MQQPRLALTAAQLTALLSAADPRHRLALSLAGDCGLRVAELTSVRLGDVDHTAGTLHVIGKGQKPRVVPLAMRTARLLPVFRRLSWNPHLVERVPRTVERWVHAAADRAGVVLPPGNCVHTLRHTYATRMVRAGVRLDVVQRLLGHARLATTARYLHSSLDDLRDAVDSVAHYEQKELTARMSPLGSSATSQQQYKDFCAARRPIQKIIELRARKRG